MFIDSNGKALHLGFQMQGLSYLFESNGETESMCYWILIIMNRLFIKTVRLILPQRA